MIDRTTKREGEPTMTAPDFTTAAYWVCEECGQPSPAERVVAEGCPNPACYVGAAEHWAQLRDWGDELWDYLQRQTGLVNRQALAEQWERNGHPRPEGPEVRERNHTRFRPWVPPQP